MCEDVLACLGGKDGKRTNAELRTTEHTAARWRGRFVQQCLTDEPGPGVRRRSLLDEVREVIAATLEEIPRDATHWSRASMVRRSGLSESTVGRIWPKLNLKPHLIDGVKLSTDPLFVEKVVDVAGLYHNPLEEAVVLSVERISGGTH